MDGMTRIVDDGVIQYRWNVFENFEDRMTARLTTRGTASGTDDLDLRFRGPDDVAPVRNGTAPRLRIAAAIGCAGQPWVQPRQVHGVHVARISGTAGVRAPECDGLYVEEPGVIAAVLLADCLPVILYDPVRHAGTICHAGWRGTVGGIAGTAVHLMVRDGSRPQDIIAAAGPGIGPCCYKVGEEVARQFLGVPSCREGVVSGDSLRGYRVDLESANRRILAAAGLDDGNIGGGGLCTACTRQDFFSHRKEGKGTGRYAALMVLR